MAFTDKTDGSRIILWASEPLRMAVSVAVKVGDLLTEAGGLADGNAASPAPAYFIAGETAAANATITVYRSAVIQGITGATAGSPLYLSDVAGGYTETPSTTQRQRMGTSLSATEIFVRPERSVERFAVSTGVIDATYDGDRYFFVASERVRVVAVEEINSAIENTSATTTVMVEKHVDAQAIGHANEKSVLAAALNLKTGCTANTRQSLGLTATAADLVLEKGHALALNFTNALTEYVGTMTVWLEPA
ncbi:MAG: hypothetical protein EPO21_11775 [Chloroflexota bacterium]|nr:MAG: hypothetical protein EPO21_11775 [Chloroflexota bacterium]